MKSPKLHQKVAVYGIIAARRERDTKTYGNALTRWHGRIRFVSKDGEYVQVETHRHFMIMANRRQCVAIGRKKKRKLGA